MKLIYSANGTIFNVSNNIEKFTTETEKTQSTTGGKEDGEKKDEAVQ